MDTTLRKTIVDGEQPVKTIFQRIKTLLPDAYWPWFFLILSAGLIFWRTELLDEVVSYIRGFLTALFEDTARGWDKGYRKGYGKANPNSSSSEVVVAFSPASILLGILALALLAGIMAFFIWLHYKVLYLQVLRRQRSSSGYTVLYVFWLILFWRGLVFIFNSFKTDFDAESIAFATFTTALCIMFAFGQSYRQNQRQKLILIQQRTQAELDALKAQVNPHFLFNSLNNIYGTAISEDSPRTAESIQQLSGIVRYVMEESRLQTTDIQRELRFVDDFVELQRIRLPNQENIAISTDIDWDEKPAQVVPLLLNPLIENAFKYGISIQYPCFVHIRLRVQEGTLTLITENSVLPRTGLEEGTGLGLANVRQRLALAYPDRHTIHIEERDGLFRVNLTIAL